MSGDKVRILCYDRNDKKRPIVALVETYDEQEDEVIDVVRAYTNDGETIPGRTNPEDLAMLPEHVEGYVCIYLDKTQGDLYTGNNIYRTPEAAAMEGVKASNYVTYTRVEFDVE